MVSVETKRFIVECVEFGVSKKCPAAENSRKVAGRSAGPFWLVRLEDMPFFWQQLEMEVHRSAAALGRLRQGTDKLQWANVHPFVHNDPQKKREHCEAGAVPDSYVPVTTPRWNECTPPRRATKDLECGMNAHRWFA